MPENEQEKNTADEESEKSDERSYYYDDACGYEIYQPDEESEDDS